MASLFGSILKAPRCLSCMRNFTATDLPAITSPFKVQTRGKKKKPKSPPTIPVRLLKNVAGYGPKGSIVPVAQGRMRNIWYPQRRADYMTLPQLRDAKNSPIERDYTFGMSRGQSENSKEQPTRMAEVKLELLPPQRAQELLETLIPDKIDFYRTVIPQSEPHEEGKNKNLSETPRQSPIAGGSEATHVGSLRKARPTPIFGSVSTGDIVIALKALLAEAATKEKDVARLVLGQEDISIVRKGALDAEVETDRIKILGDFEYILQVKGAEPLRRVVNVKAQE